MMEWKLDMLPKFDRLLEEMLRGQNISIKFRRIRGFLNIGGKEPYANQTRNIASEIEEFGKAWQAYTAAVTGGLAMEEVFKAEQDMVDALADIRQFIYEGLWGMGITHTDEQLCFRDVFHTLHIIAQLGLLDDISEPSASKFKIENTLHMVATWANQLLHFLEGDIEHESCVDACKDTWLRTLFAVYILHTQLRSRETAANEDYMRMADSLLSRFVKDEAQRELTQKFWEEKGVQVRFEKDYPNMICYSDGNFAELDAPRNKFLKPVGYSKPTYTSLSLHINLKD